MDQLSCGVSTLWEAIFRLQSAAQVPQLNQLPGLWEYVINPQWKLYANGHSDPITSNGVVVQPFRIYFEFNGWPAGVLDPQGLTIAAGSVTNLDTLLEAILAEVYKLENGRTPKEDNE